MSKSSRVFALGVFSLFLMMISSVLWGQITEAELMQEIQKELLIENELLEKNLEEARIISERIRELREGPNAQQRIKAMIVANDIEGLKKEFDRYAVRLDNLLLQDVSGAQNLYSFVNGLFADVSAVQDQLLYYKAALDYYKNNDLIALQNIERFFSLYSGSLASSKAKAMALKILIGLNQDSKAERDYISAMPQISSPEITYLSAHVLYNLGRDKDALALFDSLEKDPAYGEDSKLMANLIVALGLDPKASLEQFNIISRVVTNSPFVTLALARLNIINGNWVQAEEQYKKFYSLFKDNRAQMARYEMVLSLLNANRRQEALTQLEELMQNTDAGEYYTTFLYLWADLMLQEGKNSQIQSRFQDFRSAMDLNRVNLPRKAALLARLEDLKKELYKNPDIANFESISKETLALAKQLTDLHNTIIANSYGLPKSTLIALHKHELEIIFSYATLFENYSTTHMLRYMPDTRSIQMVEAYQQSLSEYEAAIENIKTRLEELEHADAMLQRQNELERSIEILTRIFETIDQIKVYKPGFELDPEVEAQFRAELAEMEDMRDFHQYDNSLSLAVQQEIDDFLAFKATVDEFVPVAKKFYTEVKPSLDVDKQLAEIRLLIDANKVVPDEYVAVINALVTRFDSAISDVNLINMHLDYSNIMVQDNARSTMSFEQSRSEQDRLIREMTALSTRISSYINSNPDFKALNQPMSLGHIFSKANLYYYLAELSYSTNRKDITEQSLDYYRKVLEADPKFYMRDAALYNIAFFSSYLLKDRIETLKDDFWVKNPKALTRPAELLETEQYYAEAIAAYTELIENHPFSSYKNEAMYRMGLLYFAIGSDAAEPVTYYKIAREKYFDHLVNDPNNPYRYEAMYQRGWTYLNSNDEESMYNALGDFMTLLAAIEDKKITDPVLIADYTDASISNIAYALIAVDGSDYDQPAKGAAYIVKRKDEFLNYVVINSVIDEAIRMKRELSAPMHVTDFMFARMNLEPLSVDNPLRLKEILNTYYANQRVLRDNADIRDLQFSTYMKVLDLYHHDSDWLKANRDKDINAQLSFIKEAYDFMETRLNNSFLASPSKAAYDAYQKLLDDYSQYPQLFSEGFEEWKMGRLNNVNILARVLAEHTNDPLQYWYVINKLYAFNDAYPSNSEYFVNEALAYQMNEMLYETMADSLITLASGTNQQGVPASVDSLFASYKNAVERYSSVLVSEQFKNSQRIETYIGIKLKLADIQIAKRDYLAASLTYQSVFHIESELTPAYKRDLYIKLAELADINKDRIASESWYRKAMEFALNNNDRQNFVLLAQTQIAKGIDEAKQTNNFSKVGDDYLRLAAEYKERDPNQANAFKISAAGAYKSSADYQKSIDLIIEVASSLTVVEDVYGLFAEAWIIADSLKQDKAQATQLKEQFKQKFPASLQTYAIRLQEAMALEKSPANKADAAPLYLALHEDIRNKRINSGADKAEELFLKAILVSTDNENQMLSLMDQFSKLYPGHNKALDFLEAIAVSADAKGDAVRFKQLAKELYSKDRNRSQNYQIVAERELKAVLDDFNSLYENKQWQQAFAKRDEFKRIEAAYVKEGLRFATADVNAEFVRIEKEYKDIQDKIAFMRNFDTQLTNIERAFMNQKAADMLRVNVNTRWMGHIAGGEKRVDKLKAATDAEVAKVNRLLDNSRGKGLDMERLTRAYNVIARMYEHSASAVRTQIEFFISRSNEIIAERNASDYNELLQILRNQKEVFANAFVSEAYLTHLDVYDLVYMAGYTNKHVEYSLTRLKELDAMPAQLVEDYLPDGTWQIQLKSNTDGSNAAVGRMARITSPKGVELSQMDIPAGHTLTLRKNIRNKVAPDYGYAQLVYPYDAKIKVNGVSFSPSYQAIDTLDVSKPSTTRYAIFLNPNLFQANENVLEFEFANNGNQALGFAFALRVVTDKQKLEQAIPLQDVTITTGTNWRAFAKAEGGSLKPVSVVAATVFPIDNAAIIDMQDSRAKAIWVPESSESLVTELVFETDIMVDTEFRSGYIVCAAPEYLSLVLNGVELESEFMFDYNPEPMEVFPLRYDFKAGEIVKGKNTLRLIVKNQSEFRGIVGEIKMLVTGKDGGVQ